MSSPFGDPFGPFGGGGVLGQSPTAMERAQQLGALGMVSPGGLGNPRAQSRIDQVFEEEVDKRVFYYANRAANLEQENQRLRAKLNEALALTVVV